jgi:hypothetical protein
MPFWAAYDLIRLSTLHQHSKYLDEMNWSARGNVLNSIFEEHFNWNDSNANKNKV